MMSCSRLILTICMVIAIILCFSMVLVSCTTNKEAEKELLPEEFELVLHEVDSNGYTNHKVIYHKETELFHEYKYTYTYDHHTGYRSIDTIETTIYTKTGEIIMKETN